MFSSCSSSSALAGRGEITEAADGNSISFPNGDKWDFGTDLSETTVVEHTEAAPTVCCNSLVTLPWLIMLIVHVKQRCITLWPVHLSV